MRKPRLDPLNRALSLAVQMDNQEQKALILLAMGIAYRAARTNPTKLCATIKSHWRSIEQLVRSAAVAANLHRDGASANHARETRRGIGKLKTGARHLSPEIGAKKEMGDTLIDIG